MNGAESPTQNVLVTGGAGSVGREVVRLLAAHGHRVRVFDLPGCDFGPVEGVAQEIVEGNIVNRDAVHRAVAGVDVALHLAALLPPNSERSREATMAVNVQGTTNLIDALRSANRDARLVLSSSVCVYGDTSTWQPPIRVDAPLSPSDLYAQSKIEAERLVVASGLEHAVLRISGISVPAFLEPPEVWPFQAEQRIEFVCRDDVVRALAACVEALDATVSGGSALRTVFNIAGGPTWRMRGYEYVARFNEVMGLPPEEGRYSERPGYFYWYDTGESQAILGYQQTTFEQFLERLDEAIETALGE